MTSLTSVWEKAAKRDDDALAGVNVPDSWARSATSWLLELEDGEGDVDGEVGLESQPNERKATRNTAARALTLLSLILSLFIAHSPNQQVFNFGRNGTFEPCCTSKGRAGWQL